VLQSQSNPQFRFNSIFCFSGCKAPLPACTALANHVTHVPCESQGTTRARFCSHTPIATCFSLPSTATLRKGHRGGERCAGVVLRCLSSRHVVVQVWGASTWSQRSSLGRSLLPLWYLAALTKVHRPQLKILLSSQQKVSFLLLTIYIKKGVDHL